MSTYRREFRVPRKRLLRALFSRQGLVLTLQAEVDNDSSFIATITPQTRRRKPQWHDPEEIWWK